MPAAPEFLYGLRPVGTVEVAHKLDIHYTCRTSGDIRIRRKIAVYLKGKAKGSKDHLHSGMAVYVIIYRVYNYRKVICYKNLLHHTPEDKQKAVAEVCKAEFMMFF